MDESVTYAKERHAFGRPIGADQAIRLGCGSINEHTIARLRRGSRTPQIGEGTIQVQRMVIARELGPAD